MLSIYYKIWADAIHVHQVKEGKQGGWKLMSLVIVSFLQGINLFSILLLIKLLTRGGYLVIFPMHIFNIVGINTMISLLLTYFAPFVIINYLLVFSNDKYKEILNTYGNKSGKLYRNYAIITIGVIVVPLVFKAVFL